MGDDGRTLVTKSSFRMLNTLYTLGSAPEPNLTILWSEKLPDAFKRFCARVSADTDSIQYENDDLMRPIYGDDYGIACCVSAMKIGKQMQFFGARCNLAKLLLLTLNGGKDENTGMQVAPEGKTFTGKLDYDEVMKEFAKYRAWLSRLYINTLNVIHFMHDKYAYEKIQMALHDTEVERFMALRRSGTQCYRRFAVRDQVRFRHSGNGRERAYRALRDRGRLPEVRQRRRQSGRYCRGSAERLLQRP